MIAEKRLVARNTAACNNAFAKLEPSMRQKLPFTFAVHADDDTGSEAFLREPMLGRYGLDQAISAPGHTRCHAWNNKSDRFGNVGGVGGLKACCCWCCGILGGIVAGSKVAGEDLGRCYPQMDDAGPAKFQRRAANRWQQGR